MQPSTLSHLNHLLEDALGRVSVGPLYKWIHSRDLRFGLEQSKRSYEFVPQVDGDRWVLARWIPPPEKSVWEAQMGTTVAYPRGGWYQACDVACDPILAQGVEPNERMTYYLIGLQRKQAQMSKREIAARFDAAREYRAKEQDRQLDDYLSSSWTAFGNLPGKRGGHVSFGGI